MGGNGVDAALRRFNAALDSFEAAVLRHQQTRKSIKALETEIQNLSEDRSRLAQELDEMRAYASDLDKIQKGVSKRLTAAIDNIRTVLEGA
jgi:predicted  nucleic acid-binding Zn-ribbon protein